MESFDEPVAKRRKVTANHPSTFTGLSTYYVAIARTSVRVVPPPNRDCRNGDTDLQTQSVIIKNVDVKETALNMRLMAVDRKGFHELWLAPTLPSSDSLVEILRDCARLESIWKYPKSSGRLPLACSRASLTPSRNENDSTTTYRLEAEVLWLDSEVAQDKFASNYLDVLKRYQPHDSANSVDAVQPWSPRDFYENVHVPEKTAQASEEINIGLLQCTLYPFQRRAVRWLLAREGVAVQASGWVSPLPRTSDHDALPDSFRVGQDVQGRRCYVSQALGVVSSDLSLLKSRYRDFRGGILAEEMGLGKTVEMIALMCLHSRHMSAQETDPSNTPLRRSRATLIITPVAILEQWKQEIQEHAPSLKVLHYQGVRSKGRRALDPDLVTTLADQDVVLTTYNVISKEIHYVAERPDRDLRHKQRFDPPKSPLTQISWWRVCLDEAQNVESGVSNAAKVARLIPRVNAWAVSGTPIKTDHKDLFGLLLFLQYEPWCQSQQIWNRILNSYRILFKSMLQKIAIRHNKEAVREDLRLPPQTRHTITVPFTAIEEQHYAQLFHEMCEDCGLDRTGAPLTDDWDPESSTMIEKFRSWLTRLRQTCLHPEVGGRNRRALGRSGGPLRSVMQVLEVMIDQNDTLVRAEQRAVLLSQIRRGQMMENAKDTKEARNIWNAAYKDACVIVDDCRSQLTTELGLRQTITDLNDPDEVEEDKELETRVGTFKQRLRVALEVKHICIFFLGNAYFQMKSDPTAVALDSQEFKDWELREEAAYEDAKMIRSEMLAEVLTKANRLMEDVKKKATSGAFVDIAEMGMNLDYGGIESRKVFEKLHRYCEAMNRQAKQYMEWRAKMVEFLQQSLIDEDEGVELQGDEYESSTKHQDEMYAYMEALRALFADRNDALTGQTNTLIMHEMKLALQAAKRGEGPAPERLILFMADREKCRVPPELGSLRGIITEIRHLITALQWQDGNGSIRARAELGIANEILQFTQRMSAEQMKAITALEREVDLFRDTMNNRLEYYRALQKISDTVAPYAEEDHGKPVDMVAFGRMVEDERKRGERLSTLLSKRRYLGHLKAEQDPASSSHTQRICIICQSDFENGTLTVCGHQFCKDCIRLWWNEHRTCPMCKKHLKAADFYDITYKPSELVVTEENTSPPRTESPESSERSVNRSIYSDISATTLNQIKNIDLDGSSFFGTKVDTMCRHILWLRDHDPGSKAIIFSQYREFLDVLSRAFRQYKIASTRFDDRDGIEKFKSDPAVECFLLHAKAHATGLNLVNASHVFLCEPLINTAIELQAIARVHRIGQHRATTVWMYLVADTVEESIYDISVMRRLAHMKRQVAPSSSRSGTATPSGLMESTIDAANSLEMQAADLSKLLTSGKSGGEVVGTDDLWKCLFGRVKQKDTGFSASAEAVEGEIGRFLRAEAAEGRRVQANA